MPKHTLAGIFLGLWLAAGCGRPQGPPDNVKPAGPPAAQPGGDPGTAGQSGTQGTAGPGSPGPGSDGGNSQDDGDELNIDLSPPANAPEPSDP